MAISNPFRLFNPYFDRYVGGERRPVFFDIDETMPCLRRFEEHLEIIQSELALILPEDIPRYHEVDAWQYKISGEVDPDKDWKVFLLFALGQKPKINREKCPETTKLLDQTPHLM